MSRTLPFAELCCPVCKGDLVETGTHEPVLRCEKCDKTFPVICGIPDLRIFGDHYIGLEEDRAKGRRLAELAKETDFAGLLAAYWAMPDTRDSPEQARQFTKSLLAAPARASATLDAWRRVAGHAPPAGGRFLEVGCGTAPMLAHAQRLFGDVIGIDIAFRWLVVARKRLDEAGSDAPLVAACAEALPFRAARFGIVASESSYEVTRDPPRAAAETFRVLRDGGAFWLSTPNRWSVGPDPHVGAPAGGWWPQALLFSYARRHGALPPLRHLMSAASLPDFLRDAGFADVHLGLPDVADAQRGAMPAAMASLAHIYQAIKDAPLVRETLLGIGPVLLATARKPNHDATSEPS